MKYFFVKSTAAQFESFFYKIALKQAE